MQSNIILSPITIPEFTALIQQAVKDVLFKKISDGDRLMTSEEVQNLLQISHTTLQKWRNESKIPFIRIGRKIYYNKDEILQSLSKNI